MGKKRPPPTKKKSIRAKPGSHPAEPAAKPSAVAKQAGPKPVTVSSRTEMLAALRAGSDLAGTRSDATRKAKKAGASRVDMLVALTDATRLAGNRSDRKQAAAKPTGVVKHLPKAGQPSAGMAGSGSTSRGETAQVSPAKKASTSTPAAEPTQQKVGLTDKKAKKPKAKKKKKGGCCGGGGDDEAVRLERELEIADARVAELTRECNTALGERDNEKRAAAAARAEAAEAKQTLVVERDAWALASQGAAELLAVRAELEMLKGSVDEQIEAGRAAIERAAERKAAIQMADLTAELTANFEKRLRDSRAGQVDYSADADDIRKNFMTMSKAERDSRAGLEAEMKAEAARLRAALEAKLAQEETEKRAANEARFEQRVAAAEKHATEKAEAAAAAAAASTKQLDAAMGQIAALTDKLAQLSTDLDKANASNDRLSSPEPDDEVLKTQEAEYRKKVLEESAMARIAEANRQHLNLKQGLEYYESHAGAPPRRRSLDKKASKKAKSKKTGVL